MYHTYYCFYCSMWYTFILLLCLLASACCSTNRKLKSNKKKEKGKANAIHTCNNLFTSKCHIKQWLTLMLYNNKYIFKKKFSIYSIVTIKTKCLGDNNTNICSMLKCLCILLSKWINLNVTIFLFISCEINDKIYILWNYWI